MPHFTESDRTGAKGVSIVQLIVEQQLGWIFRRNLNPDTGLDAQVEVVLGNEATGLILGLQIKTGSSYFSECTRDGWRYRGDFSHLRYWRQHNLTIIIVLVDEQSQEAYWVNLGLHTEVHEAEKSWTIEIPKNHRIDHNCWKSWMDLAWAASPKDALYRYCTLQGHYLETLVQGGRVAVEVLEWNNKTRGQADFQVVLESEAREEVQRDRLLVFAGAHDVIEYVRGLFPWADVDVDDEYYEDHEDVPPDAVFQDSDSPGGYFIFPGERPSGLRPYADDGEASNYRFLLTLNDIGKAYTQFVSHAENLVQYPPYYAARILSRTEG